MILFVIIHMEVYASIIYKHFGVSKVSAIPISSIYKIDSIQKTSVKEEACWHWVQRTLMYVDWPVMKHGFIIGIKKPKRSSCYGRTLFHPHQRNSKPINKMANVFLNFKDILLINYKPAEINVTGLIIQI